MTNREREQIIETAIKEYLDSIMFRITEENLKHQINMMENAFIMCCSYRCKNTEKLRRTIIEATEKLNQIQGIKFKLFMCHLGNGITVCNKAVEECGDYKTIAHIDYNGKISLYVNDDYIPFEEMGKIKVIAEQQQEKFHKYFESLSPEHQYAIILDKLPHKQFMETLSDKRPLKEKLPELILLYYSL